MSYPLPRAPQEQYTKWFKKNVEQGLFKGYSILWVGTELPCRFRSEELKSVISPQHVFIVKGDVFEYAVVDNTDTFFRLPKKFYTYCFPGVHYSNIPTDNKMNVQLTKNTTMTLPYIPDSFAEQKRNKSNSKRRKVCTVENEDIDFKTPYPRWHVIDNVQNRDNVNKQSLLYLVRSLLYYCDSRDEFHVTDPFATLNLQTLTDVDVRNIKIVLSFVYHYCRAELGCFHDYTLPIHDLTSLIEALCSTD